MFDPRRHRPTKKVIRDYWRDRWVEKPYYLSRNPSNLKTNMDKFGGTGLWMANCQFGDHLEGTIQTFRYLLTFWKNKRVFISENHYILLSCQSILA